MGGVVGEVLPNGETICRLSGAACSLFLLVSCVVMFCLSFWFEVTLRRENSDLLPMGQEQFLSIFADGKEADQSIGKGVKKPRLLPGRWRGGWSLFIRRSMAVG